MPEPRIYVASHSDGSQTLVTLWDDTHGWVARRRHNYDTWGAPTPLQPDFEAVS